MSKINLKTTDAAFHALHESIEGTAKSVRVDADMLRALLADHSAMVAALGHAVHAPAAKRVRPVVD